MPSSVPEKGQSLHDCRPDLAADWHPTKNALLTPKDVRGGSGKVVWWRGACGHEWSAKVFVRVGGQGCPICAGKRVAVGFNDLSTLEPVLSSQWHETRNGRLTPRNVTRMSQKKVWWRCPFFPDHEWEATIGNRVRGTGCPICAGRQVKPGFNDLATTEKVIASEWHPTRNGPLTSKEVTRGTRRGVWWLGSCGHEWQASINDRTSQRTGCPFCFGNRAVLRGHNDLATTRPDVAALWHPTRNETESPSTVSLGSKKKIWWLGPCGHSWTATVQHLTRGQGCAVCRGFQIEEGFNDLASQDPEIASQWHPTRNQSLTPNMITASSNRLIWWQCTKGHEWRTSVNNRRNGKVGCPSCADYGYRIAEPGWVYLLEHEGLGMQQIGISNSIEQRLAQHRARGWSPIDIIGPMPGDRAKEFESDALKTLTNRGATLGRRGDPEKFDGFTEAWPVSSLRVADLLDLTNWIAADRPNSMGV